MEAKFEHKPNQKKERLENRGLWARRRIISKAASNNSRPCVSLNLRTAALKRPYLILPMLTPFAFWILCFRNVNLSHRLWVLEAHSSLRWRCGHVSLVCRLALVGED